ncbi:MAG: hypothetical protein QNL62_09915 [Gammaproteobacteria bacterium]|nr:hypothetical protein [Gammaproteobacteria bacterium]
MTDNIKDKAVIEALMERFQNRRLPRVLDIKKKVDQGNKLDNFDIEFLEKVFNDARQNEHYMEVADEEFKTLFMKILSLYKEITQKAMENEQKS